MKKTEVYRYLGVNGTIESPVLLEGVPHVKSVHLVADEGYVLTKDNKNFVNSVRVAEKEVALWKEVKDKNI